MSLIKKIRHQIFRIRVILANSRQRAELYRDKFYFLGKNVALCTKYIGGEPYLISIHDNVTVGANVKFINHDGSCFQCARYLGIESSKVDKVGSIELMDNCFIGAYSILMPNTRVGKNSIIAAGSVVSGHIPDNEVWGGIPAHFIMSTETYANKVLSKSQTYPWKQDSFPKGSDIRKARQQYFFNNDTKSTC